MFLSWYSTPLTQAYVYTLNQILIYIFLRLVYFRYNICKTENTIEILITVDYTTSNF